MEHEEHEPGHHPHHPRKTRNPERPPQNQICLVGVSSAGEPSPAELAPTFFITLQTPVLVMNPARLLGGKEETGEEEGGEEEGG